MKFITKIVGACLGLALIGSVGIVALNNSVKLTRASAHNITLNIDNSPDLSNGEGIQDINGVKWEYSNASNSENGHVVLKAEGYFGVKSDTDWGYTHIESVKAIFTDSNPNNDETLWLLKSTDGNTWHEAAELVSGADNFAANDWRYIRFYSYSDTIDISSVHIGYSCSAGISATEDVDLAKIGNVRKNNILEAEEVDTVSPNSVGGKALKLKNGVSGDSSYIDVSFTKIDSWHEIFTDKIEFDYCHTNNQYKPSIQLMNGTNKVGTVQKCETTKTNYKVTDINEDWWHCEVDINSMVALYVDHGDHITANSAVDGIRIISSGNTIIDNLKIGSSESTLGNYNSPTWKPSVGNYLWIKTCWVGKLHRVNIDDTSELFTYVPSSNSPFYIYCDAAGTVDITVEIECGYNHRTQTITKTFKIN